MFLTLSQANAPHLSQLKSLKAFLTYLLLSPCVISFSYAVSLSEGPYGIKSA